MAKKKTRRDPKTGRFLKPKRKLKRQVKRKVKRQVSRQAKRRVRRKGSPKRRRRIIKPRRLNPYEEVMIVEGNPRRKGGRKKVARRKTKRRRVRRKGKPTRRRRNTSAVSNPKRRRVQRPRARRRRKYVRRPSRSYRRRRNPSLGLGGLIPIGMGNLLTGAVAGAGAIIASDMLIGKIPYVQLQSAEVKTAVKAGIGVLAGGLVAKFLRKRAIGATMATVSLAIAMADLARARLLPQILPSPEVAGLLGWGQTAEEIDITNPQEELSGAGGITYEEPLAGVFEEDMGGMFG